MNSKYLIVYMSRYSGKPSGQQKLIESLLFGDDYKLIKIDKNKMAYIFERKKSS